MKITVLGCGSSIGVPSIGNNWGKCDPNNPKNRRRRCSILVESDSSVILVDTSPDLREQLLDANVQKIDGVLFTHGHADHTHGLDDLRPMFWRMKEQIQSTQIRKLFLCWNIGSIICLKKRNQAHHIFACHSQLVVLMEIQLPLETSKLNHIFKTME